MQVLIVCGWEGEFGVLVGGFRVQECRSQRDRPHRSPPAPRSHTHSSLACERELQMSLGRLFTASERAAVAAG